MSLRALGFMIALKSSASLGFSEKTIAQPGPRNHAPACLALQLTAAIDAAPADQIDGGVGHHATTLLLRNQSAAACTLSGVPNLRMSSAATHSPIFLNVCSPCSNYLFGPQPQAEVILQPKQPAYLVLGFNTNDGNGACTKADPSRGPQFQSSGVTLRLYLSGQRKQPLQIRLKNWRSCGAVDLTPVLAKPPKGGSLNGRTAPR